MKWLIVVICILFAAVIAGLEIWKRLVPDKSEIALKIEIAVVLLTFVGTVSGLIKKAISPSTEETIKKVAQKIIEQRTVPLAELLIAA